MKDLDRMAQGEFRAKVRGIYATALTRLLLDHDFKVVQPSNEITERLGVESSEGSPDLNIQDRRDRQGIEASGSEEALEALRSALRRELIDVILRGINRCRLDVEFPYTSKRKLDEYRIAVVPTVRMHHFYKACGDLISSATDMAEKLLLRGHSAEDVENLLKQTIDPYFPFEGSEVNVEHVKMNGAIIGLGRAIIETYDESTIGFRREIRSRGVYDGLGIEREAGDRAVTEAKLSEYCMITKYYSEANRFKGAYINLNTPVEVYLTRIRYVDLEVDLCVWPGGDVKVIDEEMIEKAASEGVITDKLFKIVKAKAEELSNYYSGRPIS